MVSRGQLVDAMAVGYSPTCQSKPGLWPCYPIMPRFGLMGIGAYGQMIGRRYPNVTVPVIPRYGMSGLTMDGTGIAGTGLFNSDMSTWNVEWWILLLGVPIFALMVYSTAHQAGQTKLRAGSAAKRRRKGRAAKLRARAKRLEEREGIFGGLLFGG